MKKNIKKKKGFTLIELIIVVAVLGILALIAVPKFGEIQKNSKAKADIATAKTIADTAAMLITDGTIELPTNATLYEINTADEVAKKLQNSSPKVQLKKNNVLYYQIDSAGVVTVYAGVTGKTVATDLIQVYPDSSNWK